MDIKVDAGQRREILAANMIDLLYTAQSYRDMACICFQPVFEAAVIFCHLGPLLTSEVRQGHRHSCCYFCCLFSW